MTATRRKKRQGSLLDGQETNQFFQLATAMQESRDNPAVLAHPKAKGKGSKLGEILAFVRGLRLSARLIYILRERLANYDVEVHWGHVQDNNRSVCSPECDIIIHRGGHVDRWNGGTDKECVMDFRFYPKSSVLAVISCKSQTEDIDPSFAKVLKKDFKVKNVFIFAEAVEDGAKERLRKKARKCGYVGFWYLYRLQKHNGRAKDKDVYLDFLDRLRRVLPPKAQGMRKAG